MTASRMMVLFCLVMGAFLVLIPNLLWLIGFVVAKICGGGLKYAPWGWTALGLVSVFLLSMAYGYYVGRWRIVTKDYEYASSEVPAEFDGFRIVHISDLHLSTFDDRPEKLQEFMDVVNQAEADLICFTGDLVTLGRSEAEPYASVLSGLKAKHGVVSVLGNHDFLIYRDFGGIAVRESEVEKLAAFEKEELGWNLLRNTSVVIPGANGSKITVIGVDNKNCTDQGFQTIDRGDLSKAMADTDGFRVLLTHDPGHWDAEVVPSTDIQLTLSGHTHAAQVKLFGWSPAALMFKRVYGRYAEEGQTLFVNPGLGCTAPFRIGARPEVTVITLRHEPDMKLARCIEVAGRQGVAADDSYYYISSSTALYKYTKDGELVQSNEEPFGELELPANHFGDIDVFGGEIYTGIETFMDGVGKNIQVAVYDAESLQYKYSIPWNEASGQVECCGLAVDAEHGHVWMADWVQGHELYCYDLETREYVGKVRLEPAPRLQQGIVYHDGRMYISCDDGDADKGEHDNIYVAEVYSDGGELLEVTEPRVWRTMDDFKLDGEIEGLTFDDATGEFVVLSNRGARIILGMPKGFYEGYDHEIHEIYIYKK